MRILVTGGGGQLGSELRHIIETGHAEIGAVYGYGKAEVFYTDADSLDITDDVAVDSFFSELSPDAVINCAAMTNVDGCEKNEKVAYRVNAEGVANLARACDRFGSKLVQVSTDYVFPGTAPGDRVETDATSPLSAYGRTKLAGERFALELNDKTFVVRTAWLYGYVGSNFVKTMLRLTESRDSITVVDDQIGNPTSANDLAYEILKLLKTEQYGIYHCTNNGVCSWAAFAKAIIGGAGYDPEIVESCSSREYAAAHPGAARRPAYSALSNKRLRETIGDEMRAWEDALSAYLSNLPFRGREVT